MTDSAIFSNPQDLLPLPLNRFPARQVHVHYPRSVVFFSPIHDSCVDKQSFPPCFRLRNNKLLYIIFIIACHGCWFLESTTRFLCSPAHLLCAITFMNMPKAMQPRFRQPNRFKEHGAPAVFTVPVDVEFVFISLHQGWRHGWHGWAMGHDNVDTTVERNRVFRILVKPILSRRIRPGVAVKLWRIRRRIDCKMPVL